ncbi:hypothetical protein [Allomuricauda sp. F6463D]|uniref:hypothetical protein n=1 Tax=Allomuricauda sp. F6463D TaxID=2926409 RepID=UPI001FF65286|nr:hypothetical protein [Muricauda sp. F6463D]MCK0161694.1 hypothetical protein [Muricauda sp. F6463D]
MKQLKVCLLAFLVMACSKDDTASDLPLDEQLLGKWTMTNYYDDHYFVQDEYGIIEQIVPDETDYEIEFIDNPKEIKTTGFLKYNWGEYEIVNGEKVVENLDGFNTWQGDEGDGLHTGTWRIENGKLISTDVSQQGPDEFEEYSIISSIELKGDVLTLTIDNSQFGSHLTGEIIIEYKRL